MAGCGSQMDRKATERVYVCMQEGRIPKEWRIDLIVPIWKRKGDVQVQGQHTTQPSTETVGDGSRRKDQENSRR